MVSPEHGSGPGHGPERPLPHDGPGRDPGPSRLRHAVERRSAVLLVWLSRMPRWFTPLVLGALFVSGLMAPWWVGAPCLVLILVFLVWLAYLGWPALDRSGRAPRVLMIVVVAFLTAARLLEF
ncbi:DUF6703 family protein [Nocardiopsis sp. CNT312]|uniref:DUF6703 family protein n=1 Tax=Nocardiopsis sp. CNT312 TaxID=1137268 RepID=UPI00048F88C3|nr:DUF6703 family protein [Nocardiopsis sp. CNT312]